MDPNKILVLDDFEKGSCIDCNLGVIVPDDSNIIDFAKCKAETGISLPIFNFNLYGECYNGYLPKNGDITSKSNLPCERKYFISS